MNLTQALILVAASFAAGVMNAMAGGGTILTFPSLIFLGLPAIAANATSTVGLLPAAMTSLYGYIDEVREQRKWLKTLFLPSLIGGAIGSVLLLRTPEKTFAVLAPLLILFATVLFMVQGLLARSAAKKEAENPPSPQNGPSHGRWTLAVVLQLGVAVYGGYFGAAAGVMVLALMLVATGESLARSNAFKNVVLGVANATAAVAFAVLGDVHWDAAAPLALGLFAGGRLGPIVVRRANATVLRTLIGFAGLALAVKLAFDAYG